MFTIFMFITGTVLYIIIRNTNTFPHNQLGELFWIINGILGPSVLIAAIIVTASLFS
jgi:hypothetical protein